MSRARSCCEFMLSVLPARAALLRCGFLLVCCVCVRVYATPDPLTNTQTHTHTHTLNPQTHTQTRTQHVAGRRRAGRARDVFVRLAARRRRHPDQHGPLCDGGECGVSLGACVFFLRVCACGLVSTHPSHTRTPPPSLSVRPGQRARLPGSRQRARRHARQGPLRARHPSRGRQRHRHRVCGRVQD